MLERVMSMPPAVEAQVYDHCVSLFQMSGDEEAIEWFTEELEAEAMYQGLQDASNKRLTSVLFAVPVMLSAVDSLETFGREEGMADLVSGLGDCGVVDSRAQVGLVNRALSLTDLVSRTPGQLRRLHDDLTEQLARGEGVLRLPDDFDAEIPHGACTSPEVRLHFLVGVAHIREELEEDLFPDLADYDTRMGALTKGYGGAKGPLKPHLVSQGILQPQLLAPRGVTEDGLAWEQSFMTGFDKAFDTLEGALNVVAPQGFYQDLVTGEESARELALMLAIRDTLPPDAPGPLRATITPAVGGLEGDSVMVEVFCPDPYLARVSVVWPVLGHEKVNDAMLTLAGTLEASSIALVDGFEHPRSAPTVSVLLH